MKSHRQLLCLGVSASIALAELSLPAAPRLSVPPEGVAFGGIAAGEAAAKSIGNLGSVPKVPILKCRIIRKEQANIMQIACAVAGSVPKFSDFCPQKFNTEIDMKLFKDVPLLCCYKKVNK